MSASVLDIHKLPAYSIKTIAWQGNDIAALNQYQEAVVNELYIPQHCLSMVICGDKTMHTQYSSMSMTTGDIIFLPKGTYLVSDIQWHQHCYESAVILLPDELLVPLRKKLLKYPITSVYRKSQSQAVKFNANTFLNDWMRSFQHYFTMHQSVHYNEMLEARIHELLLYLIQMDKTGTFYTIVHSADRKQSIHNVIDEYFRYKLSIEELATIAGLSLSGFKREIFRSYGKSPGEVIFLKKMKLAELYLSRTSKSISEIAEEVGYATSSHFIQAFKKYSRKTPLQARLENQERHFLN
jgi:AraC-like DNA-binding protein